jgi:hypothetical protein
LLNHGTDAAVVKQIRELTDASLLPIVGGSLLIFSPERYALCFDQLCKTIRQHPAMRYILTLGDFNDDDRPAFYDLYSKFAGSLAASAGEVLLCAQTYAKQMNAFRLFPTVDYHPLVTAVMVSSSFVVTPFGRLENSDVWYSTRNITYLDASDRFDGMTRRSEMSFWYSPAGFLYLAHQAALIRAYHTKSRRIVVYSRFDVGNTQFLKLIFTFEAIGVGVEIIFDEDFNAFLAANGMDGAEIFSRAGPNSLVVINGEAFYSNDAGTARTIMDAQVELIATPGIHHSAKDFFLAFGKLQTRGEPQSWRRIGAVARQMIDKFNSYPLAQQQVVLETFVERWRTLSL